MPRAGSAAMRRSGPFPWPPVLVGAGLAAAAGALAWYVLTRPSGTYSWGWHILWPDTPKGKEHLAFLVGGLAATVQVSVIAIAISILVGLNVALLGLSRWKFLRALNRGYVEVVRAVPLLVLVLWVYYGLPVVFGVQLGVFVAGIVALSLSDSAFQAEIFRAGIQSVEKGQVEAARSVGLNGWQTMRLVVLPQAIRRILPALGNQFVYMLKMSSILSIIGYQELTRRANELTVTEYRPLEIYTFLVLEYLVLILAASWLVRRLERRMARAYAR
jgi:His/Glu/Gln/Arg/opine family amino acid ABC transporter permease subunit